MRKNLTEIVFILDRSGSMSGLERDTIGGFNSMIEQQKKAEGEALISTVLFDNVSEVLHDRVNVRDIRPMTDRDYTVRGCTALLDAIGGAIHHIGNVHKYARHIMTQSGIQEILTLLFIVPMMIHGIHMDLSNLCFTMINSLPDQTEAFSGRIRN
ncbi:Uncharacterised protein [uncultured Clostridium sp.]|nr:Uncharacterised protein [uncultured Clostridium sp.]